MGVFNRCVVVCVEIIYIFRCRKWMVIMGDMIRYDIDNNFYFCCVSFGN